MHVQRMPASSRLSPVLEWADLWRHPASISHDGRNTKSTVKSLITFTKRFFFHFLDKNHDFTALIFSPSFITFMSWTLLLHLFSFHVYMITSLQSFTNSSLVLWCLLHNYVTYTWDTGSGGARTISLPGHKKGKGKDVDLYSAFHAPGTPNAHTSLKLTRQTAI